MYDTIVNGVFPFMKGMRDDQTALAVHMKDARFTRPPEKAGLLAKVFDSKLLGYYYLTNTPISQYPKLFFEHPQKNES